MIFHVKGSQNGDGVTTRTFVEITAAEIATGNATPLTVIPCPGPEYAVVDIRAIQVPKTAGTAYATNTDTELLAETGPVVLGTCTGNIAETTTKIEKFNMAANVEPQWGDDVLWRVGAGNPTAGGSRNVYLDLTYRIIRKPSA